MLLDQGKYDKAEERYRPALDGHEKALGAEHPDALVSTWWLARFLHGKSNFEESNRPYDRAWEGYKATLSQIIHIRWLVADSDSC